MSSLPQHPLLQELCPREDAGARSLADLRQAAMPSAVGCKHDATHGVVIYT